MHVAKVPGKSECKSRSLAMFFQVVVFCCHILLSDFITDVFMFLLKTNNGPHEFCSFPPLFCLERSPENYNVFFSFFEGRRRPCVFRH